MSKMSKLLLGGLAGVLGLSLLLATAGAQQDPPFKYYGSDVEAGAEVAVWSAEEQLASATADADGVWYVEVAQAVADDDLAFSVNGVVANHVVGTSSSSQASVALTLPEEPAADDAASDAAADGDAADGDDGDSMMSDGGADADSGDADDGDGDSMMSDGDAPSDDGDATAASGTFPATGTGGLASDSGLSAGLLGLLIAVSVVAVAGLGYRRMRSRA